MCRLQVFESAHDQPCLHDAFSIHHFPLENPSRIDNVARMLLGAAFKRSEVKPPAELVEHGLRALALVLQGLLPREDVVLSLDDRPFHPGRIAEHYVIIIVMLQLRQRLAIGRHEQKAHLRRELHLNRSRR